MTPGLPVATGCSVLSPQGMHQPRPAVEEPSTASGQLWEWRWGAEQGPWAPQHAILLTTTEMAAEDPVLPAGEPLALPGCCGHGVPKRMQSVGGDPVSGSKPWGFCKG